MRRCCMCKVEKPLEEFAFRSMARGIRSNVCRACHAVSRRSHYERTKATYIENERLRVRGHRERNRVLLVEYFKTHPCVDCGETDPVLLEFDHRDPADKVRDIGRMIARYPWARVFTEIAKCDVRCVACHRRRTAAQFGWRRLLDVAPGVPIVVPSRPRPPASDVGAPRICRRCGERKPAGEFALKNPRTGNRSTLCRACQRAYAKEHYAANKAMYVAKARRNRRREAERVHAFLVEYFREHPCVDCGATDPVLLEFDHRDRAEKVAAVSWFVRAGDWDGLLAEIAKCDVRCVSCHRRKTAEQFGWSRYLLREDASAA